MRDITYICAYYRNPGMLREQLRLWRAFPADLREHFHAIVTDDGSPKDVARALWSREPVEAPVGIASFQLYRTMVDVRWNWLFCRNLGASKAVTDWILLTDIDHALPVDTLRAIMTEELDPAVVYRFSRIDAPAMTPYKPHPNSWLMTRGMYDRIGGYDERFSGFYGTDADFRERVHANARAVVMRTDALIRYPREHIPDASTVHYLRKQPEDLAGVTRIRAERKADKDQRPKRLTFEYVLDHQEWTFEHARVDASV